MEPRILERLRRRAKRLLWLAGLGLTAACRHEARADHQPPRTGELETLELRYQGAAGGVTYPELAEDLGYFAPIKLKRVGDTISGPQDIQTVVTGDVDFGGAFNGAIINLVAAKAPIVSVITLGFVDEHSFNGFYVLEDSPLKTARDLIGKQVAMNTVGAHSEFMLKEWLLRSGLHKQEIKQVTLLALPPLNAEQSLRQRQVDVTVLGGILRDKALERGGLRRLFTDFELFGHLASASYVLRRDFARDKPKASRKFVEATARALEWTRTQPRAVVIERLRRIITTRGRGEDPKLLDYWHPSAANLPGGVIAPQDFQIWIDWLVKDGALKPGQVSKPDLFTNEFNAYGKVAEARLDP